MRLRSNSGKTRWGLLAVVFGTGLVAYQVQMDPGVWKELVYWIGVISVLLGTVRLLDVRR